MERNLSVENVATLHEPREFLPHAVGHSERETLLKMELAQCEWVFSTSESKMEEEMEQWLSAASAARVGLLR